MGFFSFCLFCFSLVSLVLFSFFSFFLLFNMCLPARQAPPWFEENMMNRNDEKDDEKGKKTKISSTHVPGRGHRAMYRYENMNMNMNIPIAISWRLSSIDAS